MSDKLNYDKIAKRFRVYEDWGDPGLGDIYEAQGFDGKPRVISKDEMDQLIASGHTEIWRGIADAHASSPLAGVTGADFARQFREGDAHYPGMGLHGNGTYTTTWQLEALGYSDSSKSDFKNTTDYDLKDWPGVLRMALPPDAKVIDIHALKEMRQKAANDATRRGDDSRYAVFADSGRYAAVLGYDAIRLGALSTRGANIVGAPPSRDHYIILNRSILAVQEAL